MLNLPFGIKLENKHPDFGIGSLEIPAYGSLTVNESIALSKLEINDDLPIGAYYVDVIAIFVDSRIPTVCDHDELLKSLYALPTHVLEQAIAWVKKEQNQWQDPEPESEKKDRVTATGQESIGESNSPILTSPDLAPEILETAPST